MAIYYGRLKNTGTIGQKSNKQMVSSIYLFTGIIYPQAGSLLALWLPPVYHWFCGPACSYPGQCSVKRQVMFGRAALYCHAVWQIVAAIAATKKMERLNALIHLLK
jgi:hypothetical protein